MKTDQSIIYANSLKRQFAQLDQALEVENIDKAQALQEMLEKRLANFKKRGYITGELANYFDERLQNAIEQIEKSQENFTLSLMHTNDTHAHLDNIAKKATAIKEVRASKPNALLIDAGDVLRGLYISMSLKDKPI